MPPSGGVRTNLSYSFTMSPAAWGPFSPGIPLSPVVEQPARSFDFKPNINSTLRPRAYETFGFPALRAFANVELVRLAIETRKDQIERQNWKIKPTDNKKRNADDPRIATLTKFWAKPDGVTPLATFLRLVMEDLLALDAPAMEMRRTRGGTLIGLEVIPGDTIHPMVDVTGRRPRDPNEIAYQQVIKGVAWADLTNRDLLYLPRNPRPNHLYGFGPVEQIIVTINTILRRQASQLSHFTDSNVPAGLMNAPEGWDLTKIIELQTWFDDKITGNTAEQNKIVWGPAGSKYQAFKDAPVKDEFDEWLARIVAFAFSLPPTPFIRQMNKGTANEDQDRALEEGLEPVMLWAKRWIDGVIHDEQGCPDLEFVFEDTPSIDPALQANIDDQNLRNLSVTIDEVRDTRGQDPLLGGLGKKPFIVTTSGAILLEDALAPKDNPAGGLVEPPVAIHVGDVPAPANDEVAPKATPIAPATKLAKSSPISPLRPKARRASAAIARAIKRILRKAGDAAAAQVETKLNTLGKAEDDPQLTPERIGAAISLGLDLSDLFGISEALGDELAGIAADSGSLALISIDASGHDDLTNRVFDRAVSYAERRAAELVSVKGDESLIASTRDMIRSIIANGLEQNVGADQIAENIQESTAFSADRAETIAKYEIAKANGEGKAAGWREAAADGLIITKGWQVSNDGDTCEICIGNEADGQIALESPFSSGDDFEPAHPHCSCVTVATATEPEED